MEEIKNNEAQAPQVESELDVILNENKALKAANEKLAKDFENEKKSCMRYYRQMIMLKQAVTQLVGEGKLQEEDVVKAVLTGNSVITLDDLLMTLSN